MTLLLICNKAEPGVPREISIYLPIYLILLYINFTLCVSCHSCVKGKRDTKIHKIPADTYSSLHVEQRSGPTGVNTVHEGVESSQWRVVEKKVSAYVRCAEGQRQQQLLVGEFHPK